jgi:hypothetical protein
MDPCKDSLGIRYSRNRDQLLGRWTLDRVWAAGDTDNQREQREDGGWPKLDEVWKSAGHGGLNMGHEMERPMTARAGAEVGRRCVPRSRVSSSVPSAPGKVPQLPCPKGSRTGQRNGSRTRPWINPKQRLRELESVFELSVQLCRLRAFDKVSRGSKLMLVFNLIIPSNHMSQISTIQSPIPQHQRK